MEIPNYYEFLQISPNADQETIHRVYRFLATRFHPDHPETGDADKFHLLKQAYDILSNPARRAQYDASAAKAAQQPDPLASSIDFMDNIDGELNRRLAVLALLYIRRRTNPGQPEVSLAEVETRMGFPRDYMEFTTWYLQKKAYITRADNSAFTLTADGVDFVETQRGNIPMLNKLLTSSAGPTSTGTEAAGHAYSTARKPIIVPPTGGDSPQRKGDSANRNGDSGDRRVNGGDRRSAQGDRRAE